jgi:superfamily I DNA/RNA helicase/adenylylsulfate kinase-like enzyme
LDYIGVTQGFADWIIGKPDVVQQLLITCYEAIHDVQNYRKKILVEGPIRVAVDESGIVLTAWHTDYLSGTGSEAWGFISLTPQTGIASNRLIGYEVFERALAVISLRLQGLLLDGAWIHRELDNGSHKCLAGRGTAARQFSIAYVEQNVNRLGGATRAMLVVGPSRELRDLARNSSAEGAKLETLVDMATSILAGRDQLILASANLAPALRTAIKPFFGSADADEELKDIEVTSERPTLGSRDVAAIHSRAYREWLVMGSSLSDVQRRLIDSFPLSAHPVRITGPAGSGKTLLMQLLALRALEIGNSPDNPTRVLYIAHNDAMALQVRHRFDTLVGTDVDLSERISNLTTTTLAEYGRRVLELESNEVIDKDANESKEFQRVLLQEILDEVLGSLTYEELKESLFGVAKTSPELRHVIVTLLMAEISTAIKGQGLSNDPTRYVASERQLSRLHGVLHVADRRLVFDIFQRYQHEIQEQHQVLDSDDIALSLLSRLKAPLWELKRRTAGFDYVFVDETQLFNENERRIFPLLTRANTTHTPIALALDEAQDTFGYTYAGLSALGIRDIQNETLESIQRSTEAIVKLAFFIIQRTTDLFSSDFPDFTKVVKSVIKNEHELARFPSIARAPTNDIGAAVASLVREQRQEHLKRIAIVVHGEQYWSSISRALRGADLPFHELLVRGQRLPADHPIVVVTKPAYVGGQEFDSCIIVGAEMGICPPRVDANEALQIAVEQQALRELYLSVTRARYRVTVVLQKGARLTRVLGEAKAAGLLRASD